MPLASRLRESRPHRVVHVTAAPVMGGLQRVLLALAQDQREHNIEVAGATSRGPLADAMKGLGFPVLEAQFEEGLRTGTLLALRRFLRHFEADLVHAHGARATLYSLLATWGRNSPLVVSHVHLADPWRFDGSWRSRLDRLVSGRVARIVACSEHLRNQLCSVQGLPESRTVCIPNGIDLERFPAKQREAAPFRPVVGTCVRLEQQKGIEYLLEAVAQLKQDLPEIKLVIAGEGSLRASLEQRSEALAIQDRVEWLGQRDDIPEVLHTFDLFVLPSLAEGLPLALLEAMAAGVPIVATQISGTTELIQNGQTGWLVPPAAAAPLAAAILDATGNPQEAYLRAKRARDLVGKKHGAKQMSQAFRRLYEELIGEPGNWRSLPPERT